MKDLGLWEQYSKEIDKRNTKSLKIMMDVEKKTQDNSDKFYDEQMKVYHRLVKKRDEELEDYESLSWWSKMRI